jgi:chromosomal replication initiator protein
MYNDGVEMPQNVVDLIASTIDTNVREMEGAMISILAQSSMNKKEINVELANNILQKFVKVLPGKLLLNTFKKLLVNILIFP